MSRVGATVPLAEAPAEALRLLGELSEELARAAGEAARAPVVALADEARRGSLPGALWVGPKDEAVGIAWWEPPSEVGRRIGLYLTRGYQSPATLARFLEALERHPGGPIVEVADQIPGIPPGERARVLAADGFVPVSRIDLAWPAERSPPPAAATEGGTVRPLADSDSTALAVLLDRAYRDNPLDLALFRTRRDRAEDAREAIALLLGGSLGPWLHRASFGAEVDGRLVAATIVNDYHGALVTEVMVDPDHRRRGWARVLLTRTLERLRADGRADIRLVVTVSNEPAYRLYSSMGFAPLPTTEGSTWLHAERLGLAGTARRSPVEPAPASRRA